MVSDIALVVTALVAIGALIYSMNVQRSLKNSDSLKSAVTMKSEIKAAQEDITEIRGAIDRKIDELKTKLDNREYGLHALSEKIGQMRVHCAEVSSALAGEIAKHEQAISDLKQRKK